MELSHPEIKKLALRYVELQLKKKTEGNLSPGEQSEMDSVLQKTGLSHFELVKVATNDIVAE